jgi:hypothetical protein
MAASDDAVTCRQAEGLCASGSCARKKRVLEECKRGWMRKEKQTYLLRGGSRSRHFDIILYKPDQQSPSYGDQGG